MAEEKLIRRVFDEPVPPSQAVDKVLELADLAQGLLGMQEWQHKKIQSVELRFATEFHKPDKVDGAEKFKLREVRDSTIEFGAHQGERLDDIPLAYLVYLFEAQRELQGRLKFYLNHPTIKQERENE